MAGRSAFIVAAKRTPFGAFGGKLANHSSTELGRLASVAALEAGKVDPASVDSVIFGNVIQSSSDAAYLARHIGLKAGVRVDSSALTVNRLCGSGFQSVINACQEIALGEADIVLTGGSENMSMAPFALRNSRFGIKFGVEPKMEDTLWSGLTDQHIKTPMAITAENLAEKYGISRQECDEFAISSQQRWGEAHNAGAFEAELAPVQLKKEVFSADEHPRPSSTVEKIGKLPPVFKKDGVVSAANASGICDGASAVIVASEDAVKKHGLTPLAKVVGYSVCGVEPKIMGIGPVDAIRSVLKRTEVDLKDIDLVEVNEAFAAQYLAVEKELGLDRSKTNVCGGAIALGHPLGTSGSRILAHLVHQLQNKNLRYGLGSACIGGGQGIAVLLEKAN